MHIDSGDECGDGDAPIISVLNVVHKTKTWWLSVCFCKHTMEVASLNPYSYILNFYR